MFLQLLLFFLFIGKEETLFQKLKLENLYACLTAESSNTGERAWSHRPSDPVGTINDRDFLGLFGPIEKRVISSNPLTDSGKIWSTLILLSSQKLGRVLGFVFDSDPRSVKALCLPLPGGWMIALGGIDLRNST